MKRRDIKSTSLLLMVLHVLIVTVCGKNTDITTTTDKEEPKTESGDEMKGYDFSTFENVEITGIDMDSLTDEERSILYVVWNWAWDIILRESSSILSGR